MHISMNDSYMFKHAKEIAFFVHNARTFVLEFDQKCAV
jgi:hypothetical protein